MEIIKIDVPLYKKGDIVFLKREDPKFNCIGIVEMDQEVKDNTFQSYLDSIVTVRVNHYSTQPVSPIYLKLT